eukprot:857225-Rhodomonas_salina.7
MACTSSSSAASAASHSATAMLSARSGSEAGMTLRSKWKWSEHVPTSSPSRALLSCSVVSDCSRPPPTTPPTTPGPFTSIRPLNVVDALPLCCSSPPGSSTCHEISTSVWLCGSAVWKVAVHSGLQEPPSASSVRKSLPPTRTRMYCDAGDSWCRAAGVKLAHSTLMLSILRCPDHTSPTPTCDDPTP